MYKIPLRKGGLHKYNLRKIRRGYRRSKRFKKKIKLLLIVKVVCIASAPFVVHVTGCFFDRVEIAVIENIEKVFKIPKEGLNQERLRDLLKNYYGSELERRILKNLAGWNGDRGGEQVPEEFKVNTDDEK